MTYTVIGKCFPNVICHKNSFRVQIICIVCKYFSFNAKIGVEKITFCIYYRGDKETPSCHPLCKEVNPYLELGTKKEVNPYLELGTKKEVNPYLELGTKKQGDTTIALLALLGGRKMSQKLRIYRIHEGYINYLHGVDSRVQLNKNARRPYVGVVLTVDEHCYFVPMESPKPNHINLKNSNHIMKMENGTLGLLGFNNMIPVKTECLIAFDIAQEPNRTYQTLLKKQLWFCNDHKEEILKKALKTYQGVTEKKTPFLVDVCCDFKKLEKATTKYYCKKISQSQ